MATYRGIKGSVEGLLKKARVRRPSVSVERIAESLGLEVRYAPADEELSGALIRSQDGEVVIGVNSRHHSNRQRFTIAHEIAHFWLHKGIKAHIDEDFRVNLRDQESSTAANWEEIEANRFAAELLMPTGFLLRDIAKRKDLNRDTIQSLARRYKVSPQAMEIRLANLGFIRLV